MSLFGNLFGNNHNAQPSTPSPAPTSSAAPAAAEREVVLDLSKKGPLNLEKREFVNLTKSGVSLTHIRAAAGWDMASFGGSIDLDLCAYLFSNGHLEQTVYYGAKRGQGIRINFEQLPGHIDRIVIAVVIYSMDKVFSGVKNAYVRLVDESQGQQELVRYNLSADGGKNTAVVAAELQKVNHEWRFVAVGDYSKNSIKSLGKSL